MTRLFFVRHGKTEWNLEGRYQGAHGDSPLLPQSLEEIKQLSEYLKIYRFAKIYSSPIKRALVTAQKIKENLSYNVRLEADAAFSEFNLGKMEGMKFTEVAEKYPAELDAFRNHPDKYNPTTIEGESFPELFARMTPKIRDIVKRYPNDAILIVSHGAALCAEIRYLQGIPLEKIRAKGGLANTSTTILQTIDDNQKFKCIVWNKTDYLKRDLDATDVV